MWQADAEPAVAQTQALTAVERDSADILKHWYSFTKSDLPELNRLLRDSKIPEIHLERDPNQQEQQVDEDIE